jgi:hypothetical protein
MHSRKESPTLTQRLEDTVEGKTKSLPEVFSDTHETFFPSVIRAYWSFRRHFPDLADQLYGSLDIATQKQVEKERDSGSNGTNSMSASLRGSNSSLNSVPGGVYRMSFILLTFVVIYREEVFGTWDVTSFRFSAHSVISLES